MKFLLTLRFFNEDVDQAILKQAVINRETATTTVELPAIRAGGKIHCWIYFSTIDGTANSISQYIDRIQF